MHPVNFMPLKSLEIKNPRQALDIKTLGFFIPVRKKVNEINLGMAPAMYKASGKQAAKQKGNDMKSQNSQAAYKAWDSRRAKAEARSQAALKAWDSRRAKAEARSQAALKAWDSRRWMNECEAESAA